MIGLKCPKEQMLANRFKPEVCDGCNDLMKKLWILIMLKLVLVKKIVT